MIKINLLGVERAKVKKKVAFQVGQQLTLACSLILVAAAVFIGWRYWAVTKASSSLDAEIATAQSETTRLHAIITQVQQFEQRRAQLGQRVALIKQLRADQTGPVHMLDQISRALPPLLWLTDLKQSALPNEVLIEGRCVNETTVADFVSNLEASGYFKRSIDVVGTTTDVAPPPVGTLVKFQLKAIYQPAEAAKPAPAAAPKPGATN